MALWLWYKKIKTPGGAINIEQHNPLLKEDNPGGSTQKYYRTSLCKRLVRNLSKDFLDNLTLNNNLLLHTRKN